MKTHWFLFCFRPPDPPPPGGQRHGIDTGSTRVIFWSLGGAGAGRPCFCNFFEVDTGSTRDRHGLIFFRWIF